MTLNRSDPRRDRIDEVNDLMAELLRKRYGRFYGLVVRQGLSDSAAREVIHETSKAVSKTLIETGPVQDLLPYFTKALQRQVTQYRRGQSRDRLVATDPAQLSCDQGAPQLEGLPAPAYVSDQQLGDALNSSTRQQALEAANEAIAELPDHLKQPFLIWLEADLEPRQIADILGKKPETIRPYLATARKYVRMRTLELLATTKNEREEDIDE
ncbi:sigma-70 family RNA polymerase sigma factor [Nonomuraea sp. JJY05]|jgi:DNA-directed RNA polymerase specialized sigma24 family protein|uniref:sigma-70 family RNA polymerase sigma factor n=1 Tax=Nonomuraea sp. JJY05 TaxID=3350255 RepID=UPI00373E8894